MFSKRWAQWGRSPDLSSKRDFKIDLRAKAITCPTEQAEEFEPSDTVEFHPEEAGACPARGKGAKLPRGEGGPCPSPWTNLCSASYSLRGCLARC